MRADERVARASLPGTYEDLFVTVILIQKNQRCLLVFVVDGEIGAELLGQVVARESDQLTVPVVHDKERFREESIEYGHRESEHVIGQFLVVVQLEGKR